MRIENAIDDDLPVVLRLLERSNLPTEGIESHFSSFLVARMRNEVIGCGGMEKYTDGMLIRSIAIIPERQNSGIGSELVRALIREGQKAGSTNFYLLTTSARGYFERFGFAHVEREDVPASIRSSLEFTSSCPASADVYHLDLSKHHK